MSELPLCIALHDGTDLTAAAVDVDGRTDVTVRGKNGDVVLLIVGADEHKAAWIERALNGTAAEFCANAIRESAGQFPWDGIGRIGEERRAQWLREGYDHEQDDTYTEGQLAAAAACYLAHASIGTDPEVRVSPEAIRANVWPWPSDTFKPTTPIRDLVKAGALIAAEIDRRIRNGETA